MVIDRLNVKARVEQQRFYRRCAEHKVCIKKSSAVPIVAAPGVEASLVPIFRYFEVSIGGGLALRRAKSDKP